LPLNPGEEALDDPAALVSAQPPSVLGLAFDAVGLVRSDHFDPLRTQLLIERIAVVRLVANEILGLRFDHVKIERQLHQGDLVMVRGMRCDRQRQSGSGASRDLRPLVVLWRHCCYGVRFREGCIFPDLATCDHARLSLLTRESEVVSADAPEPQKLGIHQVRQAISSFVHGSTLWIWV
jgi:hypothetical protein